MCVVAIPSAVHAQSPTSPTQPATQQASPQQASPQQSAQPATTDSEDGSNLPVSLDRIREALQRAPTLKIDFLDPTIAVFRTSVHHQGLELDDYWKIGPDTAVSKMVRPQIASAWHRDFINLTSPKEATAASPFGLFGNPMVGLPIGDITSALKSVFSNAQRGRIRRQIQAELKEIEANNAQQTRTQEASQTAKPKTQTPGVPNDPH